MSKPQVQSGLTSRDIEALLTQIEQEYYGNTVIELRSSPRRFGGPNYSLVVVAANYVGVHRTAKNTRAQVQQTFPSHKYKTLFGCMFGLLHDLVLELERVQAETRAAQSGGEQPNLF